MSVVPMRNEQPALFDYKVETPPIKTQVFNLSAAQNHYTPLRLAADELVDFEGRGQIHKVVEGRGPDGDYRRVFVVEVIECHLKKLTPASEPGLD